ncbi:MAG: 2-oxoacid:acceptor oxidoreductase family protein [Candidatus Helarchaeota archaeon]
MKNTDVILTGTGGQGVLLCSNILGWSALLEGYKIRAAETHGMAQRGGSVIVHLRFGKDLESPLISKNSADVLISFELAESIRYIEYLKKDGFLLINNHVNIPPVVYSSRKVFLDENKCLIGCSNCLESCDLNYLSKLNIDYPAIERSPIEIINGKCLLTQYYCTGCGNCVNSCPTEALYFKDGFTDITKGIIEDRIKEKTTNYNFIDATQTAIKLGNVRVTNIIMLGALFGLNIVQIKKENIINSIKNLVTKKALDLNLKAFEMGFNSTN